MAFVVEEEKKNIAWTPILVGLFVVVFMVAGVYYLFFAEVPLIKTLTERTVLEESAQELNLARQTASREEILNSVAFKSLRQQVPPVTVGEAGRSNPFQPL